MKRNNKLAIQQVDKKIKPVYALEKIQFSKDGWVHTIRRLLKISLEQLGDKLSMTPQGVKGIELREQNGTITLNSLNEVAEAMDMKLVYGFLPKDGSLELLIERKAYEMAKKIVIRSSTTMKLEDQENTSERLQDAIDELKNELKREMPSKLWD